MKYYLIFPIILIIQVTQCFAQDSIRIPLDSNKCPHGKVYTYYRNGTKKSFKTYEHGFIYGPYQTFYRNGRLKEKGFLDAVNEWTLLLKPSKVFWEKYSKEGKFRKDYGSGKDVQVMKTVPFGKCNCLDGNVLRLKSLLVGKWTKEKMIPFNGTDRIIDSLFNAYNTEITFLPNDSLLVSVNGYIQKGFYVLSSNKLELILLRDSGEQESLIHMRWPKNTLYPDEKHEHFDLELIDALNVLTKDNVIEFNHVIIKFKRE